MLPRQDLYLPDELWPLLLAHEDRAADPLLLAQGSQSLEVLLMHNRRRRHADSHRAIQEEADLEARGRAPVVQGPPRLAIVLPRPQL